ncbi:NIL domain-containing protein [Natronospora cellulosivora (SeqCode)]
MINKRLQLVYHPDNVSKAIIYDLVKNYDIVINIIQARILPDEEGKLVMDIKVSKKSALDQALKYLNNEGIDVTILEKSIAYNQEACVHCGACTGLCKAEALIMDKTSWELLLDQENCLLCGMCVSACGFNALSLETNGDNYV